jgi:hypothetical protein
VAVLARIATVSGIHPDHEDALTWKSGALIPSPFAVDMRLAFTIVARNVELIRMLARCPSVLGS